MALLHDIVFDAHHPASLARFWAAVLDEVQPNEDVIVLRDPEGNEFCLLR